MNESQRRLYKIMLYQKNVFCFLYFENLICFFANFSSFDRLPFTRFFRTCNLSPWIYKLQMFWYKPEYSGIYNVDSISSGSKWTRQGSSSTCLDWEAAMWSAQSRGNFFSCLRPQCLGDCSISNPRCFSKRLKSGKGERFVS